MAYALLILTMMVLYIRPAEAFPSLASLSFYELAIIPCLLLTAGGLLNQASGPVLRRRPITVFLIGYVLTSVFTNIANFQVNVAFDHGLELFKLLLFYLLINALLDSPRRLGVFLTAVAGTYFLTTVMAILNYHGTWPIPGFTVTIEGGGTIRRLGGHRSFGDPNDFCVNLVVAMIFALYGLTNRRLGPARFAWLVPLGVSLYAVRLTQSRGPAGGADRRPDLAVPAGSAGGERWSWPRPGCRSCSP